MPKNSSKMPIGIAKKMSKSKKAGKKFGKTASAAMPKMSLSEHKKMMGNMGRGY